MNQLKIVCFLLLLMFSSYSFAQHSDNKIQVEDSIFNAYLTIKEIADEGLLLKLDDGSEWDIQYFGGFWRLLGFGWTEQKNISHWTINDTIEIQYPNSGNLTDFILVIKNLSQDEHALAYLKQAPSIEYPDCLWVMNFDQRANQITLNDGTVWFKTTTDMYGTPFQKRPISQDKWKLGNTLTLVREGEWINHHSFLLWNHAINEMPRVIRLE